MARRVLLAALAALVVAGCGSEGGAEGAGAAPGARGPSATAPPAAGAGARVVRAWARALRAGDVARASSYWSVPARAQNAAPVLLLGSRAAVRAFNAGLTCGAVVTATRRAGAYTVATFRLVQRPGADCGPGVGGVARTAIRVRAGRIAEWYRIPVDGAPPAVPPGVPPDAPPPGPVV